MSGIAYALEDEELFEDEEDFDDAYAEGDDLEDFLERRRKRRRGRPIRAGRTARGKGLFRARPTSQYVTQTQLRTSLDRVGKQIAANGASIKKVAVQANRVTSDLAAATKRLDKQMDTVQKEVKKQAETTMLMTLLQSTPQLEAKNPSGAVATAGDVIGNVQVKRQSNLLPLVLMGGSGGLGGDGNNMLLLALALSGQI